VLITGHQSLSEKELSDISELRFTGVVETIGEAHGLD